MPKDTRVPPSDLSKHFVVAGQLPPPMTGFSYITQQMAKLIARNGQTAIIDLSVHHGERSQISYHLHRALLVIKGMMVLLQVSRRPNRIFYVGCEGGLGLIYTLGLSLAARILRFKIFIHHHSFHYIDGRRALMSLLLAATGKTTTHIFLCPVMAQRFADRYSTPIQSLIVSNSAFVAPASPAPVRVPQSILTIGLISNLDNTKGLGAFLDVLSAASKEGLNLKGVLAGPPRSEQARTAIEEASRILGARLEYRGAVYGAEKDAFFRDIDVFVFPTRYANEAQPTVLFEALSYGVPILTYDRGCIRSQVNRYGAVLQDGDDFVKFALAWLKTNCEDFLELTSFTQEAYSAYIEQHNIARRVASAVFDVPPDKCYPAR